jgi:hypothetical protein
MMTALREYLHVDQFSNQARVQSESLAWRSLAQRFVPGILAQKQAGIGVLPDRALRDF